MPSEDEVASNDAHGNAVATFATNFEFVQRLVQILGAGNLKPEGREEIGRWLTLMIDNAEVEIATAVIHDDLTSRTSMLARKVDEARIWAVDLVRPELRDVDPIMPFRKPE